MKNKNTVKTISYVMMITFLGKFMALVRGRLLGQAYGTGMELDAFLAASLLPRVFFDAIFASAITMSFIPIFSKCMQEGGRKKAFEFSNVFITFVGILMVALSLFGIVFSDSIAKLVFPGFGQEAVELCSDLLKIMFPTMIFTGLTFSFTGILQSLDSFLIPALTSVVFNTIIIAYFFGPDANWRIYGLAVVFLVGWILQAAIQVPELRKKGYSFRPDFHWNNGYLNQVGILILPVMVSTWVQPLNITINTTFASMVYVESAVSGIQFANDLYTMIVAVFVLSIMNVIFPKMSDLVNQGKKGDLEKLTGQTLAVALLFVIPMMVGLMSLSTEMVKLIFEGKKFDEFSVKITAQPLFYFSLGMVGYTLQTILSRVYFSERRGRVPMMGAIIAILSNIVLCWLLIGRMEIGGLALASSLSATVYGVVLMIPLLRKDRQVFDRGFFIDIVKMSIAAFTMAAVIYGIKPFFRGMMERGMLIQALYLAILTVIGIVVYVVAAWLLRIRELQNVKAFLLRRKQNKMTAE